MTKQQTFSEYGQHLREFIESHSPHNPVQFEPRYQSPSPPRHCAAVGSKPVSTSASESEFSDLALALFQLQFTHNAAYRKICERRGVTAESVSAWGDIPAVPTVAFKEIDLSSLAPHERSSVFHSSGTTEQRPSRHFHNVESLSIYEASLLPWFHRHLLADLDALFEEQLLGPLDKMPFVVLTPPPKQAPHSSLAYMFESVRRTFGARDSLFAGAVDATGAWTIEMEKLLFALRESMSTNRPICLLGTAFSFVHVLEHLAANDIRYRLADGSRVLETGGYKGRARALPKPELHALLTKHLGIPQTHIVTEYGMSELSSQAYDRVAGGGRPQSDVVGERPRQDERIATHAAFLFPPWARTQIISPEDGREVADGETGLIRVFDLANVRSVMAIQTEDLAVRRGDGFELIGRAAGAEPRGCSLMSLNEELERR